MAAPFGLIINGSFLVRELSHGGQDFVVDGGAGIAQTQHVGDRGRGIFTRLAIAHQLYGVKHWHVPPLVVSDELVQRGWIEGLDQIAKDKVGRLRGICRGIVGGIVGAIYRCARRGLAVRPRVAAAGRIVCSCATLVGLATGKTPSKEHQPDQQQTEGDTWMATHGISDS